MEKELIKINEKVEKAVKGHFISLLLFLANLLFFFALITWGLVKQAMIPREYGYLAFAIATIYYTFDCFRKSQRSRESYQHKEIGYNLVKNKKYDDIKLVDKEVVLKKDDKEYKIETKVEDNKIIDYKVVEIK